MGLADQAPGLVTSGNSTAAVATSASVTPGRSSVMVIVVATHATTPFVDNATVSGQGYTWTKRASALIGNHYIAAFLGESATGGTTGSITITLNQAPLRMVYHEIYFGPSTTPAVAADIINEGTNSGAAGTASSGALSSTDATHGILFIYASAVRASVAQTPRATAPAWTEIGDTANTDLSLETQYLIRQGDHASSATWTGAADWFSMTMEIAPKATTAVEVAEDLDEPLPFSGGTSNMEDTEAIEGETAGVWAIMGS